MEQLLEGQQADILARLRSLAGQGSSSKKQIAKLVRVGGELHIDVVRLSKASGLRPEQVRAIVQR